MQESQDSICAWADGAFGPASSLARVLARAHEELSETVRAITSGEDDDAIAVEIADTAIVLCRAAKIAGVRLDRAEFYPHETDQDQTTLREVVVAGRALLKAIELSHVEPVCKNLVGAAFEALWCAVHLLGLRLWPVIDRKMEINRGRRWRSDGTGHGYHVRDRGEAA